MRFIYVSLLLASSSLAAQLTRVSGYGTSSNDNQVQMWVYVPDKVVQNPALVVAIHSCQSSAQAYFQNAKIPWKQGSDGKGYITVWPSCPRECWDASSKSSLSHDGGGDSNSIANMIKYAIPKYNIDPKKVFVTGGSSGAMMSNIMAATYPELIVAVSLYSGVPAGCFSGSGVSQWNNNCSGGNVKHTADEWATIVKNMYPSYNGTRPRMQIWHGGVDSTLRPQNYNETIKQWTAVFGVSQTPTNTKANSPENGYTTYDFGPEVQGIYAPNVGHSVPSHLKESEAWFGL